MRPSKSSEKQCFPDIFLKALSWEAPFGGAVGSPPMFRHAILHRCWSDSQGHTGITLGVPQMSKLQEGTEALETTDANQGDVKET